MQNWRAGIKRKDKENAMADKFLAYTKRNDFLVCVDSDGCAMDTMDIKHYR